MSDAAEVLAEIEARGCHVRAEGDKLKLRGSSDAIALLRDRVLAVKPELLRMLAPPPLDQGLATQEVLCFRATLLAQLPLETGLVLGPRRRTVWATSREWADLVQSAALGPRATVSQVLDVHGLELLAVVIDGGSP